MNTISIQEFERKWEELNGWEIKGGKSDILHHEQGPLWVLAGPGSGKTEALIIRTLRLLVVDGIDPESIMLTTFTEKGAEELEDRIAAAVQAFGYDDEIDVTNLRSGTLHSLCDALMDEYRYPHYLDLQLLDQHDQEFFVRRHGGDLLSWLKDSESGAHQFFESLRLPWKQKYPPNTWEATRLATQLLNKSRQYRTDPDALADSDEPVLRELGAHLIAYEELLGDPDQQRCDFAALQEHFLDFVESTSSDRLFEGDPEVGKPPLEYVLVDEYQDTNPLQERIYFELAKRCGQNLTVVGDDDQALYRFRGGTVECMVRFGAKCEDELGVSPNTAQLTENFRSHDEIVQWINRYIYHHRELSPGLRAPNKEQLEPAAGLDGEYPAVNAIFGENRRETAEITAELVEYVLEEGILDDPSQIALLVRSSRESPQNAGPFVEELRNRGINVYNPRNKALMDQEEVRLALGGLIRVLDRDLALLESNAIHGNFQKTAHEWIVEFDALRTDARGEGLDEYVSKAHANLDNRDTEEWLESVMDVFYRLVSHEPFSSWRETEPNRAKRLATLTNLLEAYTNVYNGKLRTSGHYEGHISHGWLRTFYYNFIQYVANSGFDEPEDPYDQIPAGYVQVMTVHQAKGLEFPFVIAGDVDKSDGPDGTHFMEDVLAPYSDLNTDGSSADVRAAGDNIRRFFVQYSRAQDALVLAGTKPGTEQIALGHDADGRPVTPESLAVGDRVLGDRADFTRFDAIDREYEPKDGVRRRYSVTGDILSYRRCARQYGHFSDYGFSPAQAAQLYFGTVVHETLDRMHQQYRGQLDDVPEGIPSRADIERYFTQVSNALIAHGTKPMSGDAKDRALAYIKRFNEQMADELYPRVKDTEHRLQSQQESFVIEGTVDILVRDEDSLETDGPHEWEIWDYKAAQLPADGNIDLKNYRYQMQVYAGLYEQKNGVLPSRAVLYFMGESNPEQAQVEIEFDRAQIDRAMETFRATVSDIEESRETQEWRPPTEAPSEETCSACDLRWDCPTVDAQYPMRAP